jgi:glycogen synthase
MAEVCMWTKAWRSGTAWVAQCLAQSIAEAGGEITFVAPLAEPESRDPSHPNLTRVFLPREITDSRGSRITRIVASLSRVLGGWRAVFVERFRTRTFIVSIPDPLLFTIPLFAVLRASGAHILFIAHDAVPHAWRFSERFRRLERGAHALSYRLATAVIAPTPQLKSALVDGYGLKPEKVRIIPLGPFTLHNIPALPGNGQFLQFGTIRRNKCVLEVIRGVILARRTDPGIVLIIAGEPHPFEPDYWIECQAAIAEDPDGFKIQAGFFPDKELPALVATVDAFVLAYRDFDSQSAVGILAGASGRPVIATNSGGLAELFAGGMCGETIQLPVTPQGICNSIAAFRAHPVEEWREGSRKGAERLRASLSWDKIGQAYLAFAREMNAKKDSVQTSSAVVKR